MVSLPPNFEDEIALLTFDSCCLRTSPSTSTPSQRRPPLLFSPISSPLPPPSFLPPSTPSNSVDGMYRELLTRALDLHAGPTPRRSKSKAKALRREDVNATYRTLAGRLPCRVVRVVSCRSCCVCRCQRRHVVLSSPSSVAARSLHLRSITRSPAIEAPTSMARLERKNV